jgi:cytochrome c oxidase subunit IV
MMRNIRVCLDNGFSQSLYEERWFFNYWFQALRNGFAWTLITLFMVQTATLTVAIISIFTNGRFISLITAILCPINTLLMTIVFMSLNQKPLILSRYEFGYCLTYPSEVLFTVNILTQAIIKKSQQNPIKAKTSH